MWTEKGVAVLGTYIQQYKAYQEALTKVNEELAKYQNEYAGNEEYYAKLGIDSEQELYDRRRDLIDQQYEYAQAINDTENSVKDAYSAQIDAIEEWADKAIDAYNDYIDVVKESLSAERDLYEFKKSTTEKTKNIASLERRIASLSASDNASDIAERKKLQAELTDAKTDLEDHYYTHSMDAREQALDDEAKAYEESMNNYIEKLRDMLDEATINMETFMQSVTSSVMLNADIVKQEYEKTGVALDGALISPWDKAINEMTGFKEDGLSILNAWTTDATNKLKSPWSEGTSAVDAFKNDVKSAMEDVVKQIESNVAKAKSSLSDLYTDIKDTNVRASNNSGNSKNYTPSFKAAIEDPKVVDLQKYLNNYFGAALDVDGSYGPKTRAAVRSMQKTIGATQSGDYDKATFDKLASYWTNMIRYSVQEGEDTTRFKTAKISRPAYFAKGILGTKKDQFAITDESWIGEEITLAAGKNGQLQYLKKGSAVMPADISANLVEWGKINPNMMDMSGVGNNGVNVINNAINKPELNFNVEKFLSIDKVDEGCLPEVKKFVQQEFDSLLRKLNYLLKGIGAR